MLGWGITGPEANLCLERLPAYQVEFNLWERMHPDTWILNGDPALADEFDYLSRPNPYELYWRNDQELRAPIAREDDRLDRKDSVMGLLTTTDPVGIALGQEDFVHHTQAGGLDVVVLHQRGTAIALENRHPETGDPMELSQTRATWRGLALYRDDGAEPSLWTFEGSRSRVRSRASAWLGCPR